jgi:hypothetical protein
MFFLKMEEALFEQAHLWLERAKYFKGQQAWQEFVFSKEQFELYLNQILITSDPAIVQGAYALVLYKLARVE